MATGLQFRLLNTDVSQVSLHEAPVDGPPGDQDGVLGSEHEMNVGCHHLWGFSTSPRLEKCQLGKPGRRREK